MASKSLLKIGTYAEISGRDFFSTPMFARPSQNYYYLSLEEIHVGNIKLSVKLVTY